MQPFTKRGTLWVQSETILVIVRRVLCRTKRIGKHILHCCPRLILTCFVINANRKFDLQHIKNITDRRMNIMKKRGILAVLCMLLMLTACADRGARITDGDSDSGVTTIPQNAATNMSTTVTSGDSDSGRTVATSATSVSASQDAVYFNEKIVTATSGRRLVDPVVVDEMEFLSQYDVDFSEWLNAGTYSIRYILEYELDRETMKPNLSKLSNGRVSVVKGDEVVFSVYISKKNYIREHVIETSDVRVSQISGREVQLFSLSNHLSSWLYSEFAVGDCYVSYSAYETTKENMVAAVKSLLDNPLSA